MVRKTQATAIVRIMRAIAIAALLILVTYWWTYNQQEKEKDKIWLEYVQERNELTGMLTKEKLDQRHNGLLGKKPNMKIIVRTMDMMVHQKVDTNRGYGAFVMDQANIELILRVIRLENPPFKEELLQIAERWKKGDFSQSVEDHNSLT
ncbi:DUF6241 domain-containing protein [Bacillus testis]|uniref:DUF6241 domain-containing protein n=1 Tax=Bacillus testis TaxID=1622072 RepID=UPI00067F61D1|nr:DUF6241 domain-containing protein [Bacillus testis]